MREVVKIRELLSSGYRNICEQLTDKYNISSNPLQLQGVESILQYIELLGRWSPKVDLIGPATSEVIVENHILDSISGWVLARHQWGSKIETIFDIGSGAGLPGIPIAIYEPELSLVLVEPRAKRVEFLKEVRRALGLKNIRVVCGKVEDLPPSENDTPSGFISRAVGLDSALYGEAARIGGEGTPLALMVGPSWRSDNELLKLGAQNLITSEYILPASGARHLLVSMKCFT